MAEFESSIWWSLGEKDLEKRVKGVSKKVDDGLYDLTPDEIVGSFARHNGEPNPQEALVLLGEPSITEHYESDPTRLLSDLMGAARRLMQRAVVTPSHRERAAHCILASALFSVFQVCESQREESVREEWQSEEIEREDNAELKIDVALFTMHRSALQDVYDFQLDMKKTRLPEKVLAEINNGDAYDMCIEDAQRYLQAHTSKPRPSTVVYTSCPPMECCFEPDAIRQSFSGIEDRNGFIAALRYGLEDTESALRDVLQTYRVGKATSRSQLSRMHIQLQRMSILHCMTSMLDVAYGPITIEYDLPERFCNVPIEEVSRFQYIERDIGRELEPKEIQTILRSDKDCSVAAQWFGQGAALHLASTQAYPDSKKKNSKAKRDVEKERKKKKAAERSKRRNRKKK